MLTINQTFGWFYKTQFLATPCQFCEHLNPTIKCQEVGLQINPYKDNIFPNISIGLNKSLKG